MIFTVPPAFATLDGNPTIDLIIENPASIDLYCSDAPVSGGTLFTERKLEFATGGLDFDASSVVLTIIDDFKCNHFALNKIDTTSLVDGETYFVRLTETTDDPAPAFTGDTSPLGSTTDGSFIQPTSSFPAILTFKDLTSSGPITIQFRDISVTDVGDPSMDVPQLINTDSGTFTITDHNANADVTSAETIIVEVNSVDTTATETGVNTGLFQGTFGSGAIVDYDPGKLGLARATIDIDFVVDAENGASLVGFAADESYDDSDLSTTFTVGETVYLDNDSDNLVSIGDTRLANAGNALGGPYADGSIVAGFDGDIGTALVDFNADPNNLHDGSGSFTPSTESIYYDGDGSVTISLGDVRLYTVLPGYFSGSIVSEDFNDGFADIIIEDLPFSDAEIAVPTVGFSPTSHQLGISFTHGGKAASDIDVTMSYADQDPGDPDYVDPLTFQMYYQGNGLAYGLVTDTAIADPPSHDDTAKTIVSNPAVALYSLPMVQGNYALGFAGGAGGGGGGGVSRAGLVVQAVGAIAIFTGGGIGTSGPPSFDSAVFSLETDGVKASPESLSTSTSSLTVGKKSDISMGFLMPGGLNNLDHIGLYANIGPGQDKYDADTYIYFDKYKTPQITIHDPHGFFKSVNVDVTEPTKSNIDVNFVFDFAKSLDNPNVVFEAWNIKRDSAIKEIPNLLKVDDPTKSETPPLQTHEEPIVEPTVSPIIPPWIKNNAAWWSEKQISEEDFVSGIQYLIDNDIIHISSQTVNSSVKEVPDWIQNTAAWWSQNKISDDDFVKAMEWLITNGVIVV